MEKAGPCNKWHYNKALKPLAVALRNNMTKAEACLWKYVLRAGTLHRYTFHRQKPILRCIADFMHKDLMLIIEVDGITHQQEETYRKDQQKDKDLTAIGFTVLRFTDQEVLTDMNNMIRTLEAFIAEREGT